MTTTAPTGRREDRDGASNLVFTRTFRAPVDDVWAAVTESERMARWIGTWTGDPTSGEVMFSMNAEGDEVGGQRFVIEVCEPPHRLDVTSLDDAGQPSWRLRLALAEADGTTTLTFSHLAPDAELAAGVGPGWDYYLDRLVAAESGRDVAEIDWDTYYPATAGHYRAMFT